MTIFAATSAHATEAGREAERDAAAALDRHDPELARDYLDRLPAARAKVLGRLWGAVWREPLEAVSGRHANPGGRDVTVVLADGGRLVGPGASAEPFGPYPAGLAVRWHRPDGEVRVLDHPVDLLAAVRPPGRDGRDGQSRRLPAELAGSVANLALALVAGQRRRAGAAPFRVGPADTGQPDPLADAEQAVVEGHPLHPCCRTRTGMSVEDLLDCAPEWAPVVSLPVLAVRRDRYSGRGDLTGLLCAEHPGLAAVARTALPDPSRYALLPVHPWQLRRVLLARYCEALAAGELAVLPAVGIDTRPLMSLRTLAPVYPAGPATAGGPPPACHLKTAVDVQMTSAVRTVSAAAVHNGPVLSALMAEISRREGGWGGRFALLGEPASGCYVDPAHGPSASLAALARVPAARHVRPGEVAVPAAALPARAPTGDVPLVAEALRAAGTGAPAWLDAYCRLVLPPLLTLLTRWGVALEAHGQNTLVVLRGGWPVRVLYRDLGGVRVSPRRLARHGLTPTLRGDLPAEHPDLLRDKLTASLVSTQLAELVTVLAAWSGTGRTALWDVVATACRDAWADLAGEPNAAGDRRALSGDSVPVKAMLCMRLSAEQTADRWVRLPNPLAGAR
ncbi:MAG TPA: IucA/IucC family protein [Mycobacteriales bacterium]|nr:IucA/IucC family protein [Mycobacteriales bacterium]